MDTRQQFDSFFSIHQRLIGETQHPYIIAELSGNHQGSLKQALAMIDRAAETGVDAIKIQTYTADTITLNHDAPEFMLEKGLWQGRNLYDLYQEAHTPWDWHPTLFEHAKARNITLFSSPFDPSAVDLLESLDCPAYKIASFEITDIPLIQYIAATGKPIIMSTGIATIEEITEAVDAIWRAGGRQLALLHCVSGYPTPITDCHLHTIVDLKHRFGTLVGLSDHTLSTASAVASVALGGSIVEKHFVLDRNSRSVDSAFSLMPDEFETLVEQCHQVRDALGQVNYDLKTSEAQGRNYRRSLYVCKPIKKGEYFDHTNVRSIRPAFGLHPRYLPEIIGQKALEDLDYGTPLQFQHFQSSCRK